MSDFVNIKKYLKRTVNNTFWPKMIFSMAPLIEVDVQFAFYQ